MLADGLQHIVDKWASDTAAVAAAAADPDSSTNNDNANPQSPGTVSQSVDSGIVIQDRRVVRVTEKGGMRAADEPSTEYTSSGPQIRETSIVKIGMESQQHVGPTLNIAESQLCGHVPVDPRGASHEEGLGFYVGPEFNVILPDDTDAIFSVPTQFLDFNFNMEWPT